MMEPDRGTSSTGLRSRNQNYDRDTVEVMDRILRRDSCCIDVGAHRGSVLKHMLERVPLGQCFAIEALPHLARLLRQNYPRATVLETAVSDQSGRSKFQFVANAPGYSGLRRRIYDRPDPDIREIAVQVSRLDDIIPGDAIIDFIKIDIEGGEFHAMKGGKELINRHRPVIVFEAGQKSTGQYGVTPEDIHSLVDDIFGMKLSTMRRWLEGETPFSLEQFRKIWEDGSEFYFIAYHPTKGVNP